MSASAFALLRQYIHSACGLALSEEKEYLIRLRLEPLAAEHACRSLDEFALLLGNSPADELRREVLSAITTNETSFFRDEHPWQALAERVLPAILRAAPPTAQAPLRCWSAASATGQEAFSLAILLDEYIAAHPPAGLTPALVEILATDISPRMVALGREARFRPGELNRGLSPARRHKYFQKAGETYQPQERLRRMIDFQEDNLLTPRRPTERQDLILCRNVLIYFENEVKSRIFKQLHQLLKPHGWLILGATETTYGLTDDFVSERCGQTILYRKTQPE